jgi:hypothetical protein
VQILLKWETIVLTLLSNSWSPKFHSSPLTGVIFICDCTEVFYLSVALQPLWTLAAFFSSFYIVGSTPWTGDQPVGSPLSTHRRTQIQNYRTQISMLRVGFEPTIPVFERGSGLRTCGHCARQRSVLLHLTLKLLFGNALNCHACSMTVTGVLPRNAIWRKFHQSPYMDGIWHTYLI